MIDPCNLTIYWIILQKLIIATDVIARLFGSMLSGLAWSNSMNRFIVVVRLSTGGGLAWLVSLRDTLLAEIV